MVSKQTLRVCLVGVKTGRMENRERKIGRKMLFFTVWLGKENGKDRNPGRKFSLPGPQFWSSQIKRKSRREKCCHSTFTQILSPIYPHSWLMTLSPIPPDDFCPQTILITFASSHLTFTAHQCPMVQVLFSFFFFLFFFFSTWPDSLLSSYLLNFAHNFFFFHLLIYHVLISFCFFFSPAKGSFDFLSSRDRYDLLHFFCYLIFFLNSILPRIFLLYIYIYIYINSFSFNTHIIILFLLSISYFLQTHLGLLKLCI